MAALLALIAIVAWYLPQTLENEEGPPTQFTESMRQWQAAQGPLGAYRTEKIDRHVRAVSPTILERVSRAPEAGLDSLVRALTKGVSDSFQKVKLLHDWIADNIAFDVATADSNRAGARILPSWQRTLRDRQGICGDYSELMQEMCSRAGIRCEIISGLGRTFLNIGDLETQRHAWNAVQLDGRWYLIDVTWDAGIVKEHEFRKRYATTYLFADPEWFCYSHLPDEPARQHRSGRFLTKQEFMDLPCLTGRFFSFGLSLESRLTRVTIVEESTTFVVKAPDYVVLTASLERADGEAESEPETQRTLVRRLGEKYEILVSFPRAGTWRVCLVAKLRGDATEYIPVVAHLEFESHKGTERRFPKVLSVYDDLDGCLDTPLSVPLAANTPVTFRIRLSGCLKPQLLIGGIVQPDATIPAQNVYEWNAKVAEGASVCIGLPTDHSDRSNVVVSFAPDKQAQ